MRAKTRRRDAARTLAPLGGRNLDRMKRRNKSHGDRKKEARRRACRDWGGGA